jgi:hypothetical protein
MKVNLSLDLTDDQLRAISGKKRNATRVEVRAFVEETIARLSAGEIPKTADSPPARVTKPAEDGPSHAGGGESPCGPMDHVYPAGPPLKGAKCFCGKRSWGSS